MFFVSGGSEAVESAWKLARQWHTANGERRWKAVSRNVAYHGTTMGALSINGIGALRSQFEPLVPEVGHVRNTNRFHRPDGETEEQFTAFLLDDLRHTLEALDPTTVAMVIMEPVQNAGGVFTPPAGYFQGVREICDEHGILLCADEVICGFGRLGDWFGSEKYDIKPDIVTTAKGLSSAYASIGAVIATDQVAEPFLKDTNMFAHGITFGGHPVDVRDRAEEPRDHEARGRRRARRGDRGRRSAPRSRRCADLPIVGDIRGVGHFFAIELVRDKDDKSVEFTDEESETLLRNFVSPRAARGGPDLPRRRPRRPGHPALAAADRRPGAVRRDGRHPRTRSWRRRGRSSTERAGAGIARRPRRAADRRAARQRPGPVPAARRAARRVRGDGAQPLRAAGRAATSSRSPRSRTRWRSATTPWRCSGCRVSGPPERVADVLSKWEEAVYVVVVAGRYDLLIEVVAKDRRDLLAIMNRIRALEAVTASETFLYLDLRKYDFGTA